MNTTERKAARADWRGLVARAMASKNGCDGLFGELKNPVEAIVRPRVADDDFRDTLGEIYVRIWEVVYLERKVSLTLKPCQIKGYLLTIAKNKVKDILARGQREEQLDDEHDAALPVDHHSTRAHRLACFPVLQEYEQIMRDGTSLARAHRILAKAHGLTEERELTRWHIAAQRFRDAEKRRGRLAH